MARCGRWSFAASLIGWTSCRIPPSTMGLRRFALLTIRPMGAWSKPFQWMLFYAWRKHPHYVLQTFLYALMVAPDVNSMPLMPTLFLSINMVTRLFAIHQVCQRTAYGFRPSCPRFQVPPRKLLSEMLDEATPFKPTSVLQRCENCNYRLLCYGK